MNRRGFTLIELLVVFAIMAIVINIAVPMIQNTKTKALAVAVIADYGAIRTSAYDYFAEANVFPRSGRWGEVPSELVGSLPSGFSFDNDGVTYRWRRWNVRRNQRGNPRPVIALQVRTADRQLLIAVRGIWHGGEWQSNNSQATLVIE